MVDNDFIWRFTPSRTDPQLLEAIFVQREKLLADLLERVRESANTGNKLQTLLVGQRGIGKTHLITLLQHRVTQDSDLLEKIRIAWIPEDETITSFVQLLKRTYEVLADQYPAEFDREWLEFLLDQPPDKILKALEKALVIGFQDKTLLLLVENLDLIFEGMGESGQKQWRAFLQTHPFMSIVATSQRLFKNIQNRDQPFFGFFAPTHLKPLADHDAVELLIRVAKHREQSDLIAFLTTPEGRSRVRAIYHLAGGNHRVYIVLSGFITRDSLDELTGPFEKMADELTPYYQERMRWLAPQQRQIVEFLCSREGTCTPKEIARHILTSENSVSSQLKKLLELGYVIRSPRGRESLYELAEPLMRLASEVKEKRHKPLRLLIDFLRIWYRPEVLPQLLANAETPSLRAVLEAAISESQTSPDPRVKVLETEIKKAFQENRLRDARTMLEEITSVHNDLTDWASLISCKVELGETEEALEGLEKALLLWPQDATLLGLKAMTLSKLGRDEAAFDLFDQTLAANPENAPTWLFKGFSLQDLGRHESAVECYDRVLAIDPTVAAVWFYKGKTLGVLGRDKAAIKCFDKALKLDRNDISTWLEKGCSLIRLDRYDTALECFDKGLEIDPANVTLLLIKCILLNGLDQHEVSIACFNKTAEIDTKNAYTWFIGVSAFHNAGRYESALQCFEKALAIEPEFKFKLIWKEKGCSLNELQRYQEAIDCLDKAIEINPNDESAWSAKAYALSKLGRENDALRCFERALELDAISPGGFFTRCQSMFALRRWDSGFAALRQEFKRRGPARHDVKVFVDLVLRLSEGREELQKHVATLIDIYHQAGMLTHLGDGLIRSLRRIEPGRHGAKLLKEWREAWLKAGEEHAELTIPLRIFRVGIEYLIKGDERVLLDLVTIERSILRQALGLTGENGSEQ